MQRRQFIKKGCALCIGGAAMISFLESCQHIPLYKTASENKRLNIPLAKFTSGNFLIVRPLNVTYDILVIKSSEDNYRSYVMVCSHAYNALEFNGKEFKCSLHGSVFNINGEVKKGPAEKSLTSLQTKKEGDLLVINLR